MRAVLSTLLSLALLLSMPGVSEAAALLRPVPRRAWGRALGQALHRSLAEPGARLAPRLESALGHARLESAIAGRAGADAALSFAHYLPASAASPARFAALEPAERAAALEPALAAAKAELQPRAEALLARARGGPLGAADERELRRLAAAWFYLDAATGRELRRRAAESRQARASRLGASIAARLLPPRRSEESRAARAQLDFALEGVSRLARERGRLARGPEAQALVRDELAPYAERALDRAGAWQAQRGDGARPVYERVLSQHRAVFGGAAARPALRALRRAGAWTPLVSAVSLHAAARLEQLDARAPRPGALDALRRAAGDYDLNLAIPSWRPESGAVASVAALLESRHGAQPESFPLGGRLFSVFGVPVRADWSFYAAAPLMAYLLSTLLFSGTAQPWLLGAIATPLLYVSMLAHELGHALAARAFGSAPRGISFGFLGAEALREDTRRPGAELAIAAAGPAVNLVLAAALYALLPAFGPGGARSVVFFLSGANLVLAALNMLPVFGFDGGRVLRAGAALALRDDYAATRGLARLGAATGWAISALGAWIAAVGGDWKGLFAAALGLFVSRLSRAALLHPGTEIAHPAPARRSNLK